jgi:hypothetical protein
MTENEGNEIERFMPYVNAVTSSAEGTRRIIYVALALMTLIFFAMRNTSDPDWGTTRFTTMLQASKCHLDYQWSDNQQRWWKTEKEKKDRCAALTEVYTAFPLPADVSADAADDQRFEKRIDLLMRREIENKNFNLPLLGVVIDENDLWVASGPIIWFLLVLLNAYLARDLDNLEKASDECPNRHGADLLLMSHVFSTSIGGIETTGKCARWNLRPVRQVFMRTLFFLPVALHAWVVWVDFGHRNTFYVLIPGTTTFEFVLRFLTLGLLVLFCCLCDKNAREIEGVLGEIRDKKFATAP